MSPNIRPNFTIAIPLTIFIFAILNFAVGCASQPIATSPAAQSTVPASSTPVETPVSAPAETKAAPVSSMQSTDPAFGGLIWNTQDAVTRACDDALQRAEALRRSLAAPAETRTIDNTLQPFNDIFVEVTRIQPRAELFANVHPDAAVRAAAETCERRAKEFVTALMLDHAVYQALKAVALEKTDAETQRFLTHALRDYRRSGVDKDEATRKRLAEIQAEIVKLGQTFDRNIRDDKRAIEVTVEELEGMPADFMSARKPQANGKIRITTDYPDFFPVQTYAKRESVRRQLYQAYMSRAFPANEAILKQLLTLRYEYATLLGYKDWADYNAEDKMVKNKKTVAKFIDQVAGLARPRMKADLKEILKRKKQDDAGATFVGVWDRFYYVQKIQAERYGVNPDEVRPYFEFPRVKEGILSLAQELFALTFERVTDVETWHPSVEVYDVKEGSTRIARFFLDLHPRSNKYGHAAVFPIYSGLKGKQLPAAALVTNFPDPSLAKEGPALIEHDQVETFLHEFGHLVHQLVSGEKQWISQAGIACEWDFVEAPSQILEEWTWDPHVLSRFAHHYQTKQPIPATLVERMKKAQEFGKGVHVMRQMFYAALSYTYHSSNPQKLDLMHTLKQVQRQYGPYPNESGTAEFASFGHLNGYSSMYYTYMWSLVLAKDLFTRFSKEGLLNTKTSLDYRRAVLDPGGTVDAAEMVRNFLGRPYSFSAFSTWMRQ